MATFHPGKVIHELLLTIGENLLRLLVVMSKSKKQEEVGGVVHHRLVDVGMLLQEAVKVAVVAGELYLMIVLGTTIRAIVSTKMDLQAVGTEKAMKNRTIVAEVGEDFQVAVVDFPEGVRDKIQTYLNGQVKTSQTLPILVADLMLAENSAVAWTTNLSESLILIETCEEME